MTEQDAIERLEIYKNFDFSKGSKEAMQVAIKALEEVQQYRALGTAEDIQLIFSLCKDLEKMTNEYQKIGTVEELRVARDKQVGKKLTHEASLYKCHTCPSCKNVLDEFMDFNGAKVLVTTNNCKFCGQKLNWEEV